MGTASGAGFGGAFIQGLTSALEAGRERKYRNQQRQQQNAMAAANFLMQSGQVQDIADLEPILSTAMPEVFGDGTGKSKKGSKGPAGQSFDHKGMITQVLSSALGKGGYDGALQIPPTSGAVTPTPDRGPSFVGPIPESGEGAEPLPSKPLPSGLPSPGAAPRRMLGGVPLLTPDEASQHAVDQGVRKTEQEINAKVGLARKLLPTFQAIDPKFTLEDAMAAVGLKTQRELAGRSGPQVGTFGDYLKRKESELGHALTTDEVEAARQEFAKAGIGSTYHFGVDREAAAQRLYGRGYGDLSQDERVATDKLVNENAGAKAGAVTTGRAEAASTAPLSSTDRFSKTRELQGDWRKVSAPAEESKRALARMDIALRRFKQDPTGAAETIRVGFEKILDPSSVVREGEYARQGTGLSLMQMMEGYKQRFLEGGGNIPYDVLAGMVETARQFDEGQRTWTDLERDRIGRLAQSANLPTEAIFGVAAPAAEAKTEKPGATSAKPAATIPGFTWRADGLYLNGTKVQ